MVLVDSSIWIEAARREGRLDAKVGLEGLLGEYEALLCPPVKLEVLGGAPKSERKRLSQYFECIPYRKVPDSTWDDAIDLARKISDNGYAIPWNDLLIGSIALQWEIRVYALDRHFDILSRLAGVRLYQPGYGGKYRPE